MPRPNDSSGFRISSWLRRLIGAAAALLPLSGCGPIPALPETFDVATSGTNRVTATGESGATDLANTTWALARSGDPAEDEAATPPPGPYGGLLTGMALPRLRVGERMFLARFGERGSLIEITENRAFLPEVYGGTLTVDAEWSLSRLPGIEFRSATFAVQSNGRFGLAIVANVRLGGLHVGSAVVYAWGARSDNRIDGVFGYVIDFRESILRQLDTVADQYPIAGELVLR